MTKNQIIKFIQNNKTIRRIIRAIEKEHVIAGFFLMFALVIVFKMFSYTVFDYKFYKDLADTQQIGKVVVPVTRGTIYSSGDKETVFSTSLNLYDVAIDPQMEGDKEKLSIYLQDLVYNQLCHQKSSEDCENNLLKYLKVLEIPDYVYDEKFIKSLLLDKIKNKINQTSVTSVLLDKELSPEQIAKISKLGIDGIYPSGNFIYANPEEISNIDAVSQTLSSIIPYTKEDLVYLLRKRKLQYVPIVNKLSIHISEDLKQYISDEQEAMKRGILDINKSISNFFILTATPNRYYPENDLASQVIGFVDGEGVGHYGIEGQFNDILKGNNGQIVSRKDTMGRTIDPISLEKDDLTGEGISIITTIDRNVQKKVEELLEEGVKSYRANKGTVIVMNPKDGKIIAMANYPSYDLNNYGDVYELEKVKYSKYTNPSIDLLGYPVYVEDNNNGKKFLYDSKEIYLREATRDELGNMALVKYKFKNDYGAQVYKNDAISALYEPGSVMKAMTVAIGIDTGEITQNSMYQDDGSVTIDNFKISNVSEKCLGYNSFANALNFSCNVGMIRIVQKIGKALFYQYLNDFGFGDLTGISLAGEVYSKITPWERWSQAQLFTSSYGLGVGVTPLQLATAYSVLANGGIYIKPNIINEIKFPNGNSVVYKPEIVRRVIKESTSKIVTEMLHDGSVNGVAQNGAVEGYNVACKSGTAQIAYKGTYEKGQGSTMGTFAGYGPVEDPMFVIIVKLDRIRTSQYGGETSGHIFSKIAKFLFDYYGVPKNVTQETQEEEK